MAYAFERDERMTAAIARIMNEQVVRAREQLTDPSSSAEKRVHDARKRFKEIRALLRMIREPLGSHFDVENAWYRDAGRELSAIRDADVVLQALDKLELPRNVHDKVARTLKQRRDHPPLEPLIANASEQLVVAQARIMMWGPFDDTFEVIGDGLRRTYRDGRSAMRSAHTDAEIHEWRKFAKTHWYHVQLLREIWPTVMKAQDDVLDDLSHILGDHHDMHILESNVSSPPPELVDAIDTRKRLLAAQAMNLGTRIYAEPPDAWLARIRKYWIAWRGR